MATLWDYQNQLRKIAEHRTSGAEQEILAVYSSVLQRLQGIVGRYYTVYSNGEGTLSAADLRLAGQYKGFLQDVLHGLEQLSEPQQEAIRSAVESAYTVCYDGMAAAVKEAASGSTSLQNALHGLSASTPEAVAHIVEHPMQKLTLSHVLQKKRRQITHKIRQTLSVGLANGDSYPQMANRIADALNGDYKKAIRVVRTEANRAINRGFQDVSEEAAHLLQGSEYLEVKEWCSAEDGDVRDAHRKLDGKMIPATEAFEIDGKKAQCPGGFGVAELDINCRCFLKYALVKRDDFEKKHGKIKGETLTSEDSGGIIEAEYKRFHTGEEVNDFFYYDSREKRSLLQKRKSTYGRWKSSVTSDQESAISDYCADGYDAVNSFLRKNNGYESISEEYVKSIISDLDSAIGNFDVRENFVTYRGSSIESLLQEFPEAEDFKDLVGRTYHDNAYMSTSPIKKVAEKFATQNGQEGIVLEISVPKGKGLGGYINEFSGFKDDEYEFLLKRGTFLEIYEVDESGNIPILKCRWKD